MHSVRHVTSGRAGLAMEVAGAGAPIVFLHANVCDRRMWRDQLASASITHKAIAYDRRGFGETRCEPEDFRALTDLEAVLDASAGNDPAILVGCSLGGRIALDAALRRPLRVRALVLIAPSVPGAPKVTHPPDIETLLAQSRDAETSGDIDRLNAIKARLWLDGPLAPEGRVTGPVRDLFLDMSGIALRSPPFGSEVDVPAPYVHLAEITVPTIVIWGDLDFPDIQERCRHVAATIPKAESHEMAGAAHLPSLERPAEVTALITAFVGRHAG